jgi:superfamily II DNA or RNA helicase
MDIYQIDECHHLPAPNYECLIKSVHAKYIRGFTATPKRQDGLEKLMHFKLTLWFIKLQKLPVAFSNM